MALGSLAAWIGSPLAWLSLASRLADSPQPGMGLYALLLGGVILTSIVLGRMLAGMDRAYRRITNERSRRVHQSFLRSSGQDRLERVPTGPLGIVMTVSVIAALIALVAGIVIVGHPFVPLPM